MCFEQQIGEFKMHIWETCVETKVGTHSILLVRTNYLYD